VKFVPRIHLHDKLSLGTHVLDDIKVSIPAVAHAYQPHLVAFRLDWKVLAGVCHSEIMTVSPLSLFLPTSPKGFAIFRRPPTRPLACLAKAPTMPYVPTTRTAPHYFRVLCSPKVSAFRACLFPFRIMHFNYVRGRIEPWTTPC
jgi:hypothetical protein